MRTLLVVIHGPWSRRLAWALAYWLALTRHPARYGHGLLGACRLLPLQGPIAWGLGLYRGIWRFASLPDLKRIILAVTAGAVIAPVRLSCCSGCPPCPFRPGAVSSC